MRALSVTWAVFLVLGSVGQGCSTNGGTKIDSAISPDASSVDAAAFADSRTADQRGADAAKADASAVDGRAGDAMPGDAKGSDACVPTSPATEVCDGKDNDCNGLVDDVDVGKDGIYDCLKIALFGLAGTFGSSDFQAWLKSNGVNGVDRAQTDPKEALTQTLLDKYSIIILDRLVRDYTATEADLLRQWVEAGGGLMSMSGYTGGSTDTTRPNSLMVKLGLEYKGGLANGPVTSWKPHAISQGITSITFNGGFPVAEVAGVTGGTNTVVCELPAAKGPAGMAQVRGKGRVFVFGDEWIEFDSEWKSLPQVKVLWGNILGWLARFTN
ncbi:MAG: hypothetical protein IT371_22340 [Deltaproteobacteria bacterium]|nr:hypothetical protein [Deltaproteobacteria bacterium]